MKGLTAEESARYLASLSGLRSCCRFYDTHVHPYEVLFDKLTYVGNPGISGVVTLPGRSYTPPSPGAVRFQEAADFNGEPRSQRLMEISAMLLGKLYASVGPGVFLHQMDLSGIHRILLLPIAADGADGEAFRSRMQWVRELYGDDDRFWIAGSVPALLAPAEIEPYAASLKRDYRVKAIKCHPVVSGVDLGTDGGREWLEALLAACHKLELPLVIHGGRNNPYWGGSRGNFGSIGYLKEIDYSITKHPVILAHAAMHRCALTEIEQEALPTLKGMLSKHPNLHVDISALGFEPLKMVLGNVEAERILFGSDALYIPQWEGVTLTMHALKESGRKWEEGFVQFASVNPAKTIFGGDDDARESHDQAEPIPGGSEGDFIPAGAAQGHPFLSAGEPGSGAVLQQSFHAEIGEKR